MKLGILTFGTLRARDAEEFNVDVPRDMGMSPSERRGRRGEAGYSIILTLGSG